MKTKNIFKALAMAMLMPAMVLTTACSNDDDVVNKENNNQKGYALPVTLNVTRQGDDATTRATYNEGTKTLSFNTGDKLLVQGWYDSWEHSFAGTLTWVSGGTFSGTILTETDYTGTFDALLSTANRAIATLLPAGYDTYKFLTIKDEGTYSAYPYVDNSKAFAPTKKIAVEQFNWEYAIYNAVNGFVLEPNRAILNFTITGLTPTTEYAVVVTDSYVDMGGNVTTDGSGNATFAVGTQNNNSSELSLTVGGNAVALNLGGADGGTNKELEAGHIYNITRSAAAAAPSYPLLSAVTTSDYGKVVCAAGHLHDAKTAVPVGCTAVGIIGKVTETGHGLILALQDATSQSWNTINGWTSETTYAGTTLKVLPDDAARGSLTSYTTLGETTVSNWAVAQKNDYDEIFTNLGSATGVEMARLMMPT